MAHGPTLPYDTGGRMVGPWAIPVYVTTTIDVTYKPEEADALRTRPATSEEADRCQEPSRPDEEDGETIERDEWIRRVVPQQVRVEQRILRQVEPHSKRCYRPTNHLQVGGATNN